MKKLIALLLALVMVIGLVACGETTPETPDVPETTEGNTPETTEGTEAPEETTAAQVEAPEVIGYAEFDSAPLDTQVCVETYIQAVESWWDGCVQLYTQNEEGAYYIYDLACSEEEAAQLVPGTKIRVTGFKAEWSGEVEIIDATYEILEGEWTVEEAANVTELAQQGSEALAEKMNQLVQIDNMTVVASTDGEGNEVPYLYKWDGSGSQGDDLYFNVQIGEQVYTFTVNAYMIGTGSDSDVYKAVEALQIGDTITVGGFLYFYDGAQTHVTHVITAE